MQLQDVVRGALSLLEKLYGAQASPAQEGPAMGAVMPADVARMFEALLSGDSNARLFAWEQGPDVITKPLWQQRAFSYTADVLLQVHFANPSHNRDRSLG